MRTRIAVVDDQPALRNLLTDALASAEREVVQFTGGPELIKELSKNGRGFSVIILDLDLGTGAESGLSVLDYLEKNAPRLPVVVLGSRDKVPEAVEAMKRGADDFLEKDAHLADRIVLVVRKLEKLKRMERENLALKEETRLIRDERLSKYRMIGDSREMARVRELITLVSPVPRPVLVVGERGTGKELVAAAIHEAGPRIEKPFLTVNCAALTESLLESTLFGHEKGAFTGADDARIGLFEAANGGTLFLDEIGNMSLDFQQKILRVIEYQEFRRVRGSVLIRVDVRIVAATNRDLREAIRKGQFLEDLYDRLAFQVIELPTLRSRPDDIPVLTDYFLDRFKEEVPGIVAEEFDPKSMRLMGRYPWPGNIRELRFFVERVALLSKRTVIDESMVMEHLPPEEPEDVLIAENATLQEQVDAFELRLLKYYLSRSGGSQKDAAKLASITYDKWRYLYRKHKQRLKG